MAEPSLGKARSRRVARSRAADTGLGWFGSGRGLRYLWLFAILILGVAACGGEDAVTPSLAASEPEMTSSSRPSGVVVRAVDPDEWPQAQQACLEDFGFVASVLSDGGIEYPAVNPDQAEVLRDAIERCREMFPVKDEYLRPLDSEQLTTLYRWYVGVLIPCLEERGYSGFEPPSESTFVETYYRDPWSPYFDIDSELDAFGEQEWYALQADCPQGPPLDLLYSTKGSDRGG